MNDSSPAPTSHGADADLAKQVRSLQSLVVTVLALSLVSGIALMAFLYGQSRIVSRNLADAKMFVDDYNTNTVPRLKALQQSLGIQEQGRIAFRDDRSEFEQPARLRRIQGHFNEIIFRQSRQPRRLQPKVVQFARIYNSILLLF